MGRSNDTTPVYLRIRERAFQLLSEAEDDCARLPSVQEFCELFAVSRPTVIKALKQLKNDGDIIAKRGFGMFVNPDRQSKRYGREVGKPEGVIGLIADGGMTVNYTTYHLNILHGASKVLADSGYYLRPINLMSRGADAVDELRSMKLTGALWMWTGKLVMPTVNAIDESEIPLVTVAHHEDYFSKNYVGVSFRDGGYALADYLLKLGHRDIVYLCLPSPVCGKRELEGMRQAYADRGLSTDKLLVVPCGDDPTDKIEALFDFKVPFSAIISPTEYYQYVMDILPRHGVRVPDDCSVITDDELSTQNLKTPAPTRIANPLAVMGAAAAAGLIDIIEKRQRDPLNVVLDRIFIDGDTTRALPSRAAVAAER